jgi:maltose O-acetyltransferase
LALGGGAYVNFTVFDASERIEVACKRPLVGGSVRIGNNVWVGAGAVILKGVTIGDGAVIGAGAVVTRHVGSNEKVAGVPARMIGSRLTVRANNGLEPSCV